MYFKEPHWLLGLWWLASLESVRPSGNLGRISRLQSQGRIPSRENLFLALRLQPITRGQPTLRVIAGVSNTLVCKHQSHLQNTAQQPGPHTPSPVTGPHPELHVPRLGMRPGPGPAGSPGGSPGCRARAGACTVAAESGPGETWAGRREIQSRLGRFDDTWCLMECGKNGNGKLKTIPKFLR